MVRYRTEDGEMFVVKDPDLFAATIIPQYFDHNKFSSFARQLNFYGFRKMQAKPIRNADYDADAAKHVTFFNEKFKRGRCDLLKEIQRSTRGGGAITGQDHQKEIEDLKAKVSEMENQIADMNDQMEERLRRLELDMLGRMEQMMIAMQQHQQLQLQQQISTATNGDVNMRQESTAAGVSWDPLPLDRAKSTNTNLSVSFRNDSLGRGASVTAKPDGSGPTLPPHPKQKQFPLPNALSGVPGSLTLPPSRLNSLRGISRGLSRGLSEQSSASAVLMRNSWEDKFFSMLMLSENEQAMQQAQQLQANNVSSGPISDATLEAAIAGVAVSDLVSPPQVSGSLSPQQSQGTLSDVSDAEAF